MSNRELLKIISEYNEYRKIRGVLEKTIDADTKILIRVVTLSKKRIQKWTKKDAFIIYKHIYGFPLYIMHKKEFSGWESHEIIEHLKDGEYKTISDETAKKYLNVVKVFYKWLLGYGYVNVDIFDGINPKKTNKKGSDKRDAFTDEHLKIIFSDEVFHKKEFAYSFKYWIPLLCAELGLRQSEAAQLFCHDVKVEDSIWCLSVSSNDNYNQRTKNLSSIRLLPITKNLIRLGFLDFVEEIGDGAIFKDIQPDRRDGYGRDVSRWFSEKKKDWGFGKKLTFYSFRHGFFNRMKQHDIEEIVAAEIGGHAGGGITYRRYGKNYSLKKKRKIIEKNNSRVISRLSRIYPKKSLISKLNFLKIFNSFIK
ncbi:site-specific integrase [Photobacterium makurazakiensis]|uniref:site-specific integrase n=1 Tax=Photobacterium makurazakiensis TaxID=2910234 RepID=UPI003D1269DC